VKEVLQVELKLPSWKVLMQLLVVHGLLADEESGLPLLGLESLHDQYDCAFGGLDGSGWIGRFISGEFIASAEGDEDEISTGISNSTLGGLAC
jgi:hypothetical protein